MKPTIDVCCGSKMFWFNKSHTDVIFADIRQLEDTLCDGRKLVIAPDVICDFKSLPYPNNTFKLAVFDPPHLIKIGDNAWMSKKYGKLPIDWEYELERGVDECMRVLEPHGILIFKWNEQQIKIKDVLKAIKYKPLFGDRRSKTMWMVFMKEVER